MVASGRRLCRLESDGTAASLLQAYDPAADQWSIPFHGEFWSAVDHAHRMGRRGQGVRIAIIDTACDLSIPALASRVDKFQRVAPAPTLAEDMSHGTNVALLVARVAPEARLSVYAVAGEDGAIDASDVSYAIQQATDDGATIINLSLGHALQVPDLTGRLALASDSLIDDYATGPDALASKATLLEAIAPEPACDLCAAATAASQKGIMVFAAAGNDGAQVLCPSRAAGVVALGFTSEIRTILPTADGQSTEEASSADPHAPQAMFKDISLREVDGVLGTSFAAPLFAGAGALGLNTQELFAYLAGVRPAATGAEARQAMETTPDPGESRRQRDRADAHFQLAMKRLPHVHSLFEAWLRGGSPVTDPKACATCGVFALTTYVNHGLLALQTGGLDAAEDLLRAAVALGPWSAPATANLGRTMQAKGRLNEALDLYDQAIALRPGFAGYINQRMTIVAALAKHPPSTSG